MPRIGLTRITLARVSLTWLPLAWIVLTWSPLTGAALPGLALLVGVGIILAGTPLAAAGLILIVAHRFSFSVLKCLINSAANSAVPA